MSFITIAKKGRIALMNGGRKVSAVAGTIKRHFVTPKLPINKDGKVYVNLGCGVHTSPEFINVDTRKMPNIHYIHEVQKLPMLEDNSVDLLYASHLVEHIPRGEVIDTFKEWKRVLKPGGVLRFGVPDFDALLKIYALSHNEVDSIVNQLLGQDAPYDDHHTIWNFAYAKKMLEHAGLTNVRIWDHRKVDHHNFTDKSTREVDVAGQKILISLNIEAEKAKS